MKKVTYEIVKRGRKWFEGVVPGKGWKAKIEINDVSKNWQVGETVTFFAEVDFQQNRYGTTVKVYPLPATARKEELLRKFDDLGIKMVENARNGEFFNNIKKEFFRIEKELLSLAVSEEEKAEIEEKSRKYWVQAKEIIDRRYIDRTLKKATMYAEKGLGRQLKQALSEMKTKVDLGACAEYRDDLKRIVEVKEKELLEIYTERKVKFFTEKILQSDLKSLAYWVSEIKAEEMLTETGKLFKEASQKAVVLLSELCKLNDTVEFYKKLDYAYELVNLGVIERSEIDEKVERFTEKLKLEESEKELRDEISRHIFNKQYSEVSQKEQHVVDAVLICLRKKGLTEKLNGYTILPENIALSLIHFREELKEKGLIIVALDRREIETETMRKAGIQEEVIESTILRAIEAGEILSLVAEALPKQKKFVWFIPKGLDISEYLQKEVVNG